MTDTKDMEDILSEAARNVISAPLRSHGLLRQLEMVADMLSRAPEPLPRPALLFEEKDHTVRIVPIQGRIRIGRSEECEISFPRLREVSRFHSEIIPGGKACFLRDTDSYNGTRVMGKAQPVKSHELRDGDVIKVGSLEFVFLGA